MIYVQDGVTIHRCLCVFILFLSLSFGLGWILSLVSLVGRIPFLLPRQRLAPSTTRLQSSTLNSKGGDHRWLVTLQSISQAGARGWTMQSQRRRLFFWYMLSSVQGRHFIEFVESIHNGQQHCSFLSAA